MAKTIKPRSKKETDNINLRTPRKQWVLHEFNNKLAELTSLINEMASDATLLNQGVKLVTNFSSKRLANGKTQARFTLNATLPAILAEVTF